MRPYVAGLLSLLVVGVSTLPQPASLFHRDVNVCGMNFRDQDKFKSTWHDSGAAFLLDIHLTQNGVKDWTQKFFEDNIADGSGQGTTQFCLNVDATTCPPPNLSDCPNYKHPAAFFVHQSIATLFSQYNIVRQNMQDTAVEELADGINKVVKTFGPPPPSDNSYILTLLVGAFVGGAALAGPVWQVGAPLTGVVGGLNVAAGIYAKSDKGLPDYEQDLKSSLKTFYRDYLDSLDDTIKGIFAGQYDEETMHNNPKDWITGTFMDGKLLSSYVAEPQTMKYVEGINKLIRMGFVTQCLKKSGYKVSIRTDKAEGDCSGDEIWLNDACTQIAKNVAYPIRKGDTTEIKHRFEPMKDNMVKEFNEDYGFDTKEAMLNAIECDKAGGGDPESLLDFPAFNAGLPKCFFNLEVQTKNGAGDDKDPPPPEKPDLPEGEYKPGWCGVHVRQVMEGGKWTISASVKDDEQNEIIKVDGETVQWGGTLELEGGGLPKPLIVKPGNTKADLLKFEYEDEWDIDNDIGRGEGGHECGHDGKWDEGKQRDVDCSFWC